MTVELVVIRSSELQSVVVSCKLLFEELRSTESRDSGAIRDSAIRIAAIAIAIPSESRDSDFRPKVFPDTAIPRFGPIPRFPRFELPRLRPPSPESRDSCDSWLTESAIRRNASNKKRDSGSDSESDSNPAIPGARFLSDSGSTMHDVHDMHDMHDVHDIYEMHDMHDMHAMHSMTCMHSMHA